MKLLNRKTHLIFLCLWYVVVQQTVAAPNSPTSPTTISYWGDEKKIIKSHLQFNQNNKLHGKQQFFSPSGVLVQHFTFTDGVPTGIQSGGSGKSSVFYKHGNLVYMTDQNNVSIGLTEFIQNSGHNLSDYYECGGMFEFNSPWCMHVNFVAKGLVNQPNNPIDTSHQIHHHYHAHEGSKSTETFIQDVFVAPLLSLNTFRNLLGEFKSWLFSFGKTIRLKYTTSNGLKHGLHRTYSLDGTLTKISSFYYNNHEVSLKYKNNGLGVDATPNTRALEDYILKGGASRSFNQTTGTGVKYYFHSSGMLKKTVSYNRFLYQGISESYSESGILLSRTLYSPEEVTNSTIPFPFYTILKPTFTSRYLYSQDGSIIAIMEN